MKSDFEYRWKWTRLRYYRKQLIRLKQEIQTCVAKDILRIMYDIMLLRKEIKRLITGGKYIPPKIIQYKLSATDDCDGCKI